MKLWLEKSRVDQCQCIADLVGRVLVTDAKPGEPSHACFLAAMVSLFVKQGRVLTGAEVAVIPKESLAN